MQSAGTSIMLLASAALLSCDGARTLEGFPDEFAGVGLELGRKGERLLVVRPIEGGPSWEAGIRRDDEVISINGEPVTDMGLGDAVARLRGPPGTQLTLGLDRQGEKMIVVLRRKKLTKIGDDYQASEDPDEGAADPGEGPEDPGAAAAGTEGAAGGSADERGAKPTAQGGEALAAGAAATPASATAPPPTSVETELPTKRQQKPAKSRRRGKRAQKQKN